MIEESLSDDIIVLFEEDVIEQSKSKPVSELTVFDFKLTNIDIIKASRISFVHPFGEIVFKDRRGSLK